MRCWGRSRTLVRCKKECSFLFCHRHRWIGWVTCITIGVSIIVGSIGLFADVASLIDTTGVLDEDLSTVELSHDESSPLSLEVFVKPMGLTPDSPQGGIEWRPNYSPIEVVLANRTPQMISALELRIQVDGFIMGGAQTSALPDVQVFPLNPPSFAELLSLGGTNEHGERITVPVVPIRSLTSTYEITAAKLRPNTEARVLLAYGAAGESTDGRIPDKLFVKKPPSLILLEGSYELSTARPPQLYRIKYGLRRGATDSGAPSN